MSFSASFDGSKPVQWKPRKHIGPKITAETASKIASEKMEIPVHDIPIKKRILETKDGLLTEAYFVQLRGGRKWIEVAVDAFNGIFNSKENS